MAIVSNFDPIYFSTKMHAFIFRHWLFRKKYVFHCFLVEKSDENLSEGESAHDIVRNFFCCVRISFFVVFL